MRRGGVVVVGAGLGLGARGAMMLLLGIRWSGWCGFIRWKDRDLLLDLGSLKGEEPFMWPFLYMCLLGKNETQSENLRPAVRQETVLY